MKSKRLNRAPIIVATHISDVVGKPSVCGAFYINHTPMILQKDLKIYRFKNHAFGLDTQKFDYQLFRNKRRIANKLSDSEFHMGSVAVLSDDNISMTLISNARNINFREMEERDTYLVPVTICN